MYPEIFNIGFLPIYSYGFSILIACFLGLGLLYFLIEKEKLNYSLIFNNILLIFIISIIGGRMFDIIFKWDIYINNLYKIFFIWDGGLSMWGTILSAFGIIYFILKQNKEMQLNKWLDILSLSFLFISSIILLGQFAIGQGFGETTDFFLGVYYDNINSPYTGVIVHPTSLYMSLNLFIVFISMFILWITKTRPFYGFIFNISIISFCTSHIISESLRWDISYWFLRQNAEKSISIIILTIISLSFIKSIWQLYGNKIKKRFRFNK